MRTIQVTQASAEAIVLDMLKQDLANLESVTECYLYKDVKKHIKALKRTINFYSVKEPYDDV